MIKSQIISDENLKSKKIKSFLKKNFNLNLLNKKIIIVIGGDGFMLKTLKKNKDQNKLFYGINSGSYGFLMNKFNYLNTLNNIKSAKKINIFPLEMIVKNKNNIIKKSLAINEVSILRQSRQAANLSIKKKNKFIIKKLVSDGVLISTPAGSTAYNLSVHGPILNLDSKKLAISPISPFRPRRWRGKIVSDKSKIIVKNLDIKKRPVSAVADNFEVRDAKLILIKVNTKKKFNLLYDTKSNLQKKINLEQIRKDVG